jgi:hypothetical protein
MPSTLEPLRVKVARNFTLLLATDGRMLLATVAEHPRIRVRASTVDRVLRGAREGVARLEAQ